MCIIVDNNVRRLVLLGETDPDPDLKDGIVDYSSLFTKLFSKKSVNLVFGGKLQEELQGDRDVKRRLQLLDDAGRAKTFKSTEIEAIIPSILAKNPKSNDEHILALMILSNTRLVCTKDKDLRSDVANKNINNKRGKIYKNPSHDRLIKLLCPSKETKCQ